MATKEQMENLDMRLRDGFGLDPSMFKGGTTVIDGVTMHNPDVFEIDGMLEVLPPLNDGELAHIAEEVLRLGIDSTLMLYSPFGVWEGKEDAAQNWADRLREIIGNKIGCKFSLSQANREPRPPSFRNRRLHETHSLAEIKAMDEEFFRKFPPSDFADDRIKKGDAPVG